MAQQLAFDIETTSARAGGTAQPVKSIWRRMFDALIESRQRQADREVERYIQMRGGQLTDEIEREISRKFGGIVGQ